MHLTIKGQQSNIFVLAAIHGIGPTPQIHASSLKRILGVVFGLHIMITHTTRGGEPFSWRCKRIAFKSALCVQRIFEWGLRCQRNTPEVQPDSK